MVARELSAAEDAVLVVGTRAVVEHLGDGFEAVGHGPGEVELFDVALRDAGDVARGVPEAVEAAAEVAAELLVGSRALLDGLVEDDDAKRAQGPAATGLAHGELRAGLLAGAEALLRQAHVELQLTVAREDDRARAETVIVVAVVFLRPGVGRRDDERVAELFAVGDDERRTTAREADCLRREDATVARGVNDDGHARPARRHLYRDRLALAVERLVRLDANLRAVRVRVPQPEVLRVVPCAPFAVARHEAQGDVAARLV